MAQVVVLEVVPEGLPAVEVGPGRVVAILAATRLAGAASSRAEAEMLCVGTTTERVTEVTGRLAVTAAGVPPTV